MARRFELKRSLVEIESQKTKRLSSGQRLAELKQVLRYDRNTGLFHWQIYTTAQGRLIKPGDRAGAIGSGGYVHIVFTHSDGKRGRYRAHRLAWWFIKGELPRELDHKNRIRADNRWSNLRVAPSRSHTNINSERRSDNRSGQRGVSWRADTKKWHARITKNGKIYMLGNFERLDEAIAIRKAAEQKLYREFAKVT